MVSLLITGARSSRRWLLGASQSSWMLLGYTSSAEFSGLGWLLVVGHRATCKNKRKIVKGTWVRRSCGRSAAGSLGLLEDLLVVETKRINGGKQYVWLEEDEGWFVDWS